ncbi:MAG: hypoxanthine-guanine phosphoribosyltransferase [Gammaproteobacteria bacterium]|nr:hypoxanthine-guanine phosphoribosyltransferase [Gammaproteobacteria bacterium]
MIEEARRVQAEARCIYTEQEVEAALDRMAAAITAELADSNPLVLGVMTGALVVAGKLLPRLHFPLQVDYLHASRYRGKLSGADLQWKAYPSIALKSRTVLIVDDILDEGETLLGIRDYCLQQGAARALCAVLVDKNHNRRVAGLTRAEFTGLDAPDSYLFGYGMDYKDYLRNAPGIYAVAGT